jgi:mannose-1-phosphate guanylyltransferase
VRPERPENGYGWIVPRPWFGHRLRPIACIREKPEPAVVDTLFEQGALLNSFILIAGGRFLLDLFETTLPDLWRSLDSACGDGPSGFWAEQDLVHRYRSVPTLDFSKEILEQAASLLWVYPVPACGWLDLGTPERLTGFLSACGHEFEDGPLQSVNRGILQASQTQQGLSP